MVEKCGQDGLIGLSDFLRVIQVLEHLFIFMQAIALDYGFALVVANQVTVHPLRICLWVKLHANETAIEPDCHHSPGQCDVWPFLFKAKNVTAPFGYQLSAWVSYLKVPRVHCIEGLVQ